VKLGGRLPWLVAAVAGVALAVVAWPRDARAGHPEPRSGVTAERVLPVSAVPRTPGSLEAYAAARANPQTLDGVYCHCECSRHAGHRSLLTCFESEHGAYCDICIGEAVQAAELAARGTALAEIRRAIDERFGS
jgi:hypothetical protein